MKTGGLFCSAEMAAMADLRFSIFFCGCKQSKSLHIYYNAKIHKVLKIAKAMIILNSNLQKITSLR
jgi:hypothetical protein